MLLSKFNEAPGMLEADSLDPDETVWCLELEDMKLPQGVVRTVRIVLVV